MYTHKCLAVLVIILLASLCTRAAECEESANPIESKKCISAITDKSNRLHLVVERPFHVPDWWKASVDAINDSESLTRIVKKEHENWEYVEQWRCWVPKFCEVRDSPDSFKLLLNDNVIDVSPAKARMLTRSLFDNRLTACVTKKWTVLAMCNDYPSDIQLYCISNDSHKLQFSKGFKCYTYDFPHGRHRHMLGIDISGDVAAIFTSTYLGCSMSIIELDGGKQCFYSEMQTKQPNE